MRAANEQRRHDAERRCGGSHQIRPVIRRCQLPDVVVGGVRVVDAAWTYRTPAARYADVRGHWAFYAQRLDECWIDDERVTGNAGSFYGGWITANVTGPFKGAPGTSHW